MNSKVIGYYLDPRRAIPAAYDLPRSPFQDLIVVYLKNDDPHSTHQGVAAHVFIWEPC